MALPDTHRAQAKSLFKKGLLTQKQHDRMIARIAAMPTPPLPASGEGDAQMTGAVTPAAAPAIPATASVPAGQGNITKPATPPGATA